MATVGQQHPALRTLRARGVTVREHLWRLIVATVGSCMRYRVTGLAAEAAFFAILSVPPLVFALAGAIGYVSDQLQRRPARRRPAGGPRPLLARPSPSGRSTRSSGRRIDDGARGRSVRRDLGRLRAGPVVGVAGPQRLRRHHHDHARAGRAPGDRQDPGAVLRPLRPGDAHRDGQHPAGGRRPDPGGALAARALRVPDGRSTGRWCSLLCICFLATLYHVSVPVRTNWAFNLPGAVFSLVAWIARLVRAALGADRDRRGVQVDLRPAGRAHRRPALALPPGHRRAHRGGGQRRLRHGLPAGHHDAGPPRARAAPAQPITPER